MSHHLYRRFLESPVDQGSAESISYAIDTSRWGVSVPSAPSVVVYAFDPATQEIGADVTATVMPAGSPSVAGSVITLPALRNLTAGSTYRLEVLFSGLGNTLEAYGLITCTR